MTPLPTITEIQRNSHCLEYTVEGTKSVAWALLQSDEHTDNMYCQRDLLKKHHEQAVERQAPIIKVGDIFCAMQGKWDRRADPTEMREELQGGNYLDKLVDTVSDFYAPYSKNIYLLGKGNHEGSILKHHETNLTERLREKLRGNGSPVQVGGYCGWLTFRFRHAGGEGRTFGSKSLYYHHGWGGGGPVTKGLIDFNRLSEQIQADMYCLGHIHQKNHTINVVHRLNKSLNPTPIRRHYIRMGSYMDPYNTDSGGGWNQETAKGPRPLGGWWLKFTFEPSATGSIVPLVEVHEAL